MLLNNHSYYSFLNSTISPNDLVEYAVQSSLNSIALTDQNGMHGLIPFAKAAHEKRIKPILGAQITENESIDDYLLLLAKNNQGYSELCKIITNQKLDEKFVFEDIFKIGCSNLFILSSSENLVRRFHQKELINSDFFVELYSTKRSKKKIRSLYNFSKELNLKIVATNPAYFKTIDEHLLHRAITAVRKNKVIINLNDDEIIDQEFHLPDYNNFLSKWKSLPESLENAEFISQNCNVDLRLGEYKYPKYDLPKEETSTSMLWNICHEGLKQKYNPVTEKARARLESELLVIDQLGFSDYFLIVWDIVKTAHQKRMMTIGRGSAANSIVSYCLNLTQVDPIEHNLYFERFLNKGRSNPPDVDLDFSWKERDEIIRYVFEKYGYERVAMISTTVTFKARSAFREIAKAFGISDNEISTYSKFIPWTSAKNLIKLAEKYPESKDLDFSIEPWKSIIELASQIADFPRHLSIHPGGIVITEKPITNYTALEYAKNKGIGLIVTQPNMYSIEELGLVKIDLLSQRSLGVLRDTMDSIEKNFHLKVKTLIFNIEENEGRNDDN